MSRNEHETRVADFMYKHAAEYSLDKEEMYLLGLLHDVGCVNGEKKGHEQRGAKMLKEKIGVTNPHVLWCIEHHNDFIPHFTWSIDRHRKHFLLLKADMSIDSYGNEVGYKKRLKDIMKRYGEDSDTYKRCLSIVNWLKKVESNRIC